MRARLLIVATLLLLPGVALIPGQATADITVIGDDQQDAFVGSGALLLPSGMYQNGRDEAADCAGCSWRAVLQCEMTTAGSCRGPARLCGPDGSWLRIYLRRPSGEEVDLGAACFGSDGPAKLEDAENLLRQVIREAVPPLRPTMQPSSGVLPHLPVIFASGQREGAVTSQHSIIGLNVDLTIEPRWAWNFGDGSGLRTARAGSAWPDRTVSHAYDRAGAASVSVQAEWSATYTVQGLGPLQVADPVTQEAELVVPVGQGRAVLVR